MTIQELQDALVAKKFFLQARIDINTNVEILWAVRPDSVQEQYLGMRKKILSLPLQKFLELPVYQELGRDREKIIASFVDDLLGWAQSGMMTQESREFLVQRVDGLYDKLRRADW